MLLGRDEHRCLLAILELPGHGRLWVKRVGLTMRRSLPDFTCERTSAAPVGMSQKCQLRTRRDSALTNPESALVHRLPPRATLRYDTSWRGAPRGAAA
jgi:hypothetical protein